MHGDAHRSSGMPPSVTERPPWFTPHLIIGTGVMLLGIALILERLGLAELRSLFRLWPILLVLLGASMIVQALRSRPDTTGDAGTSGFAGLWVLIVVVVLFSGQMQRRADGGTQSNEEFLQVAAILGTDHRLSTAPGFRRADMTTLMGRARLDLRQAEPAADADMAVHVVTAMGGAVIHVPPGWSVDVRAVPVFGRVRDARAQSPESATLQDEQDVRTSRERRRRNGDERGDVVRGSMTLAPLEPPTEGSTAPRLIVRGLVLMGELTIRS